MKNETLSNHTDWSKKEIENYISETHERLFRQALLLAGSLAIVGTLPEDVERHSRNIRTSYQELLAFVKKQIQGGTAKSQGLYAKRAADTEMELNKDRIHQLQGDKQIRDSDKSRIEIKYNWKWYPFIIALEILIFICECFYNVFAFTVLGGSILLAAPASLLFSICLGVVAFKIPKILKHTSPDRRVLTGVAIAFGMLLVFIAIGLLRGAMVVGNGMISSVFTWPVIVSAIIFVVLNSFMFSAAVLLSFFLPSDEEHLSKKEHDRLSKESKEKQVEIDALEARNRVLPLEALRVLQDKADIISEEQHQEDHIHSLLEKTVHAFYSEWEIKRKRERPLSLTEPKQ